MPQAQPLAGDPAIAIVDAPGGGRILDPISRFSEILFGLIMALTFTSTLSAATADREEVRLVLFGAIGCNIAWGLVDAMMYLINALAARGRDLQIIRAVRRTGRVSEATAIVADALPPFVAALLHPADLERVRNGIRVMPEPPAPSLNRQDWLGALAVFLLVFLSTLPVVLPFLVFDTVRIAVRVSDGIAIAMLFATGFLLARYGGYHPWRTGLSMVVLGSALVAIAVALGG